MAGSIIQAQNRGKNIAHFRKIIQCSNGINQFTSHTFLMKECDHLGDVESSKSGIESVDQWKPEDLRIFNALLFKVHNARFKNGAPFLDKESQQ